MAEVDLSSFTSRTDVQSTDQLAGYRTATAGGEGRWSFATILAWIRSQFAATPVAVSEGGTGATTAAAARTALGAGTSNFSGAYGDLTGKPTLGTAAALNVPASGDAASGEVVKGSDSRLSDARTPTTHTHTASQISDATATGRSVLTAVDATAARTAISAAAASHASTHASGGSDAIKLDDLAAPDDNTDLDATTSVHGLMPKADKAKVDTLMAAAADVASGATCNIGAAASEHVRITGTTTITAFDTVAAGIRRTGYFSGALTLTHNATSLILPGGANITTAANDRFVALSLGSGNWIVLNYQKANGEAVVGGSSGGLGYVLSGGCGATSLSVDSTNYYVGSITAGTTSTTEGLRKQYIPKAGTITVAELWWWAAGTVGSGEQIDVYLRINGTTDYLVGSVADTAANKRFSNTSLSIAVALGDYLEFKITAPLWATNPSNVLTGYSVYIQ